MCFKLSPKTEVHWKMLSLLGGSSTQSLLFALSQSVPAVWHVRQAVLKPICILDFSTRDQYACIGRCFHRKRNKCKEVHLFTNAIREIVGWLKTGFSMSWDNAAVSSSLSLKHSFWLSVFPVVSFHYLGNNKWWQLSLSSYLDVAWVYQG